MVKAAAVVVEVPVEELPAVDRLVAAQVLPELRGEQFVLVLEHRPRVHERKCRPKGFHRGRWLLGSNLAPKRLRQEFLARRQTPGLEPGREPLEG